MSGAAYSVETGRWVYRKTVTERICAVLRRLTRERMIAPQHYGQVVASGIKKWCSNDGHALRLQCSFRIPRDVIGYRLGAWIGGADDKHQVAAAFAECERDGRQRIPDFRAERVRLARRDVRRAEELSAIVRRAERLIKQRKSST